MDPGGDDARPDPTIGPPPDQPPPPTVTASPTGPTGPPSGPPAGGHVPDAPDPWWQRLAPMAAAVVLIAGVVFLVLRSAAQDDAAPITDGPSVATVDDPGAPIVETTVPQTDTAPPEPTAPPLVEPSTPVTAPASPPGDPTTAPTDPAPTVAAPDAPGPTQEELDGALLRLTDLAGTWTEEVPDVTEVCGVNPDLESAVVRSSALFQQVSVDPAGIRQIFHTVLSFPDAATAERAFTADVALNEACGGQAVDLEGVPYRVEVTSSPFDAEQAATFPCSDQNSFIILQLTNAAADIPYLGQSAFGFRCGRNVTVISLTTTIDLDDLDQTTYFAAGATVNTRASNLPGSS